MIKVRRRLFLSVLNEIDNFYQDDEDNGSNVRLIEMIVDDITGNDGYSMQFWQDVKIYGLSEAIMYLQQHRPIANYTELIAVYKKVEKLAQNI